MDLSRKETTEKLCAKEFLRKNVPQKRSGIVEFFRFRIIWFIIQKFQYIKDIDICLLELSEDVIESGRVNNIPLRTICLPEKESRPGSSCFTSGINRNSKFIDAVALNLFNHTFCDEHSSYNNFGTTLNENQLCAGIPSNKDFIAPFNGKYEQDFGGPLICLDLATKQPIFTGIASSNSLSTITGEPGSIQSYKYMKCNRSQLKNLDIFGALYTLRI